ncbi:GCN5-related N-acetyltransferase [Auriscalpium vulgare]|uniref:GCN5-related N-acetyltransferase n=1 Tax=Auriscalpium vulgare TaxID=40419 RepID=A0ACB8S5Z9_9AGAM|nr:GCN5-related N-acetyltransferase [Auriscalpium vulgare]
MPASKEIDVETRQISVSDTINIRHTVLWPEQPVDYVRLPEDDAGVHFGAFVKGGLKHPIAVISLFREDLPINSGFQADISTPAYRFRKFACHEAHQGQGIGSRLLSDTLSHAGQQLGARIVWCDARMATAGWYERKGLLSFGEPFMKGSVEYIRMAIVL